MATTTRKAQSIQSKTKRGELKIRREPYWQRLSTGCHVGYRKVAEGEGTWIAKYRDGQTGERSIRSLGTIVDAPGAPAFDVARKQAQDWFDELMKGVDPDPKTVRDACLQYEKSVGKEGSPRRRRAEQDFKRLVHADPIAGVELFRLRAKHLEDWRERMVSAPTRIGRSKRFKDEPRALATINRDLVGLRAALNLAHEKGQVASDAAWRSALKPIENADRQRAGDLSRDECRRLVDAADVEIRPFLRALALLPLRPGAMAALTVRDFDPRRRTLTIRSDKRRRGGDLPPPRTIELPPGLAAHFAEQARRKLPAALLFTQANGSAWNKNEWSIKVREAVAKAELPAGTTSYSLRHATITELVIANELSLLTIAQVAGTSVRMIEKNYGHLRQKNVAMGLEALTL